MTRRTSTARADSNAGAGRWGSWRRLALWGGVALVWLGAGIGLASGAPGTVAGGQGGQVGESGSTGAVAVGAPAVPAADNEIPASQRDVEPPGPMPLPAVMPDPARFVVVTLHDEVGLGMASHVERVVESLRPGDVLVLDINTFGGRVDGAVRIRDALLSAADRGARTVAYVHPRAISAGALISLATDIIAVAPGASIGAATPIQVGAAGGAEAVGEKMVSYMRTEMRATAEQRGRSGDIAEAMVDSDREVPGLNDKGKLLTLEGKQALAWGVASVEATSIDDLIAKLGYGEGARAYERVTVRKSWAEKLAWFLTGPTLSGLLMTIGMVGIIAGLYSGGHPLPLVVGGLSLGMFFFGHHLVSLAGMEEIILFILGAALIVVEVAVPGHILPGVFGILLVVASLALGLVNFEEVPFSIQWQQGWVMRALATVFGSILATGVLTYALFRALPESRLGKRLILGTAIDGGTAERARQRLERGAAADGVIGARGVAESDLRPAGKVKIDGRRLDAVAERGFVAANAQVMVVAERGFSVVVVEVAAPSVAISEGTGPPAETIGAPPASKGDTP